jgi:hypothetical protein
MSGGTAKEVNLLGAKIMKFRWLVCRVLFVFGSVVCLPFAGIGQHSGDRWTTTSAWDAPSESTIIEVTSLNTNRLTCAVTWQGTWVGPSGAGYPKGDLKGTFTMPVPAYPGRGAAIVAQRSNHWVSNVSYQMICTAQ